MRKIIKEMLKDSILFLVIFLIQLFFVLIMFMILLAKYSVEFAQCLQKIGG